MDRVGQRARAECPYGGGAGIQAFIDGPAVIGPCRADIDLLERILPHIADEEGPLTSVETATERIAQAERIYFVRTGSPREHVVTRHGVVFRGIRGKGVATNIDTDNLAVEIVDVLGVLANTILAGQCVEI